MGAAVTVDGTTLGASTNIDGQFTLNVPDASKAVLTVSYIGMKTQSVPVNGRTHINITLEEDTQQIDDVVVVGYGVMKKSDLTGSVSSVSAEDIASRGTTRLEESLMGAVPGVIVTQADSRAGGSFNIQVRGQSSIGRSTTPLYVIDGIASSSMDYLNPEDIERIDVLKDASSTAIYGSRASNGVVIITTKGGKAAAGASNATVTYDGYYGFRQVARTPNLMTATEFMDFRFARFTTLTTEKYDGSKYAGVDASGVPHYQITNSDLESAFLMRSGGESYRDSKLYELYMAGFKGYDWIKAVTRTAAQQNHYIAVNGANENMNYRLGFGYQSEENVMKENDYHRFNMKGQFDSKISKVFEAGMSINMAYTVDDKFTTNTSYSPYVNALYFNPFVSPFDENGKLYKYPGAKDAFGSSAQFTSTVNPLIDLYDQNYIDQDRKFHMFGNIYLRANLYDGLRMTTTLSPSFYHGRTAQFFAKGITEENPEGSQFYTSQKTNEGYIANTDRFDWTWDTQIDYNKTWGDHNFTAMGLFSMNQNTKETSSLKGREIADDRLTFNALNKASGDKEIASSYTESSMVSVAARFNYSYKGKYMATVTMRADGSSRFAPGKQWGFFPSAAFAWRMSEEKFLKNADWLTNLKWRISYGVTGNNNVDDYVTHNTASGPSYGVLDGSEVNGYYPGGMINQALIWEKIKEFDFGVDFGALDNRIVLTADVYRKLSDGQIMSRSIPHETGETTTTFNIGSILNKGIEIGLNFGVVRTKSFTWDLGVNFSRNWNKILELSNGKVDEPANNRFIGERLNVLRDYKHTDVITDKGVTMHTKDGDIHYTLQELFDRYGEKYKWYEGQVAVHDWNNDGVINDDDKQIYGCTDPKWIGSITSTMNFKGFDFSFMIYTKQGQWSKSPMHDGKYAKWSDRGNQHFSFDFYIPKGAPIIDPKTGDIVAAAETHYGKYPYPNNSDTSFGGFYSDKGSAKGENYQYHNTSFVKVKNITLGYTFPKEWMKKAHIKSLRVYLNVTNPFCWSDYEGFDPEWASANLAMGGLSTVTYQIGANIKF
ncbi:MAG: TonB-dependent receptor [Alistipes sp.]|nr:TonB-dependent receptor [Alistipes sp.]